MSITHFRLWLRDKIQWAEGADEFNESESEQARELIDEAKGYAIDLGLAAAATAARRGPVQLRLVEILQTLETPAEESLLTLQQAADVLGYSAPGLRKIVARTKAGQPGIKFSQIGNGPIKFKREWLDEFTVGNMTAQQPRAKPRHW